jgi:hypothetical protein
LAQLSPAFSGIERAQLDVSETGVTHAFKTFDRRKKRTGGQGHETPLTTSYSLNKTRDGNPLKTTENRKYFAVSVLPSQFRAAGSIFAYYSM